MGYRAQGRRTIREAWSDKNSSQGNTGAEQDMTIPRQYNSEKKKIFKKNCSPSLAEGPLLPSCPLSQKSKTYCASPSPKRRTASPPSTASRRPKHSTLLSTITAAPSATQHAQPAIRIKQKAERSGASNPHAAGAHSQLETVSNTDRRFAEARQDQCSRKYWS